MAFSIAAATPLWANLVYDPVVNAFYSEPQTPDINQAEYFSLLCDCLSITQNIIVLLDGKNLSKKDGEQIALFLKRIGTPTALRLLSDLKKKTIFYPNGSIARSFSK
jgi:hypothetical protein